MARGERIVWTVPTLTLCVLWLIVTGVAIVLSVFLNSVLPGFIAKAGPFLVAGFITGRFVGVSGRRPKIIAAAVLSVVSAVAWTLFSFATTTLSADRALVLFALSLPVNMLGGAWAYFAMFLGSRRREMPPSASRTEVDPELEDLERELKNEIARERASHQSTST